MKQLFLWVTFTLFSVTNLFAGNTAYLFSYFINDSKDGLHLAYSYDGLNWTPLNGGRSYLTPTVGKDKLMRDPSVCQSPDGTFHMVWTSSWTDRIIGYASSRDLIHWSEQKAIPVMMHEPTAHNCWAPELFYDAPSQTYYIFWATTIPGQHKEIPTSESEKGLNHRIYYVTTQDFNTFSDTKMFFNPDFSVIDAAIVKDPQRKDLIMVVKNENSNPPEKNLRITRTKKIGKGFPNHVSAAITGKYWAEGPAPLFVGDTLYVYFDKYREHRYGAVRSLDHGKTWEDVSEQISFPRGIRHGTAFPVDASVVEALKNHTNVEENVNYQMEKQGSAETNITVADDLSGKRMAVIGDSYVKNHKEPVVNTWHYKFAKKYNMQYFNYGRNGNSIAYTSPRWGKAMYLRYQEMADSLDYIVVIGGHNDAFKLDSIGGVNNFKDKMEILCKGLVEKYPTAKIFFFTRWNCKNFKGSDSEKVVDAMIEVCGNYSIPIFDCARKGGIYADNDKFRSLYFQKSKDNKDTAHLNGKGHDRFLKVAENFLLRY